ncbi:MAG: hypothetical protein NC489_20560 [Ruminococcus flavefaciens]|nr:hypothetical protein [Ruminococcus flavefaciens]
MEAHNWKNAEREINIFDLLDKILHAWRGGVVIAIVFAVLLSAVQYVKADKAYKIALNTTEEEAQEFLRSELTTDEKQRIAYAKKSQVQIQSQMETKRQYSENSILMNIDPYQKPVVSLQYYIDTHRVVNYTKDIEADYTYELLGAYEAYVNEGSIASNVRKNVNWKLEDEYIEELVEADQHSNGILTVNVTGKDKKFAESLAEQVNIELVNYQTELKEKIGSHDFTLISQQFSYVSDSDLADQQAILQNTMVNLNTTMVNLTAGFTENMLAVWNGEDPMPDEKNDEEMETEEVILIPPTFNVKYFLFGFLIGIFLYCVWIVCIYVLGNRIKTSDELQEVYGLRVFGVISLEKKVSSKPRFLSCVDRFIDKTVLRKESWTLEEQWELVLTNISVSCKKAGIRDIFVTTSLHLTEQEQQLVQKIIESLKNYDLQINFAENIVRSARAFEQMAKISNVIIIEKLGTTSYPILEKELVLCMEQSSNVLGVIGLE